jgi:hypothetical protein
MPCCTVDFPFNAHGAGGWIGFFRDHVGGPGDPKVHGRHGTDGAVAEVFRHHPGEYQVVIPGSGKGGDGPGLERGIHVAGTFVHDVMGGSRTQGEGPPEGVLYARRTDRDDIHDCVGISLGDKQRLLEGVLVVAVDPVRDTRSVVKM